MKKKGYMSYPISILKTETGFKNCKTSSKTLEEAQLCFFYVADLEFQRFSKKGYPIYKITSELIFDGYQEGEKIEEEEEVFIDEDEDFTLLEELD